MGMTESLGKSITRQKAQIAALAGIEYKEGDADTPDRRIRTLTAPLVDTGGKLLPEQKEEFRTQIRGSAHVMDIIDLEMIDRTEGQHSSAYISNPITMKATEDTDDGETVDVTLGDDEYSTQKLVSKLNITYDFLQRNIMKDGFADKVIAMVQERIGYDLALVSVRGDSDSSDDLLKSFDGWGVQSEYGHRLSNGSSEISFATWAAAHDAFDDDKRDYLDEKLRFMCHPRLATNWIDVLAGKSQNYAPMYMEGKQLSPHGIPLERVAQIPTNLDVTTSDATPASVTGTVSGPFTLVDGTNNQINLNVNSGGLHTHDIPEGTWSATELAAYLNVELLDNSDPAIASADQKGHLVLETPDAGAAKEIIVTTTGDSLIDTVGISADTYSGKAAGTNTLTRGTYLWLTDPKNLWLGVYDRLRMYWEYNKDKDRYELAIYTEVVPKIRDRGAIVTVEDVSLKSYL